MTDLNDVKHLHHFLILVSELCPELAPNFKCDVARAFQSFVRLGHFVASFLLMTKTDAPIFNLNMWGFLSIVGVYSRYIPEEFFSSLWTDFCPHRPLW